MEKIPSKAETMAWRFFTVVTVLILGFVFFVYGEGSPTVIVEKILGYQTVRESSEIQQESKKLDAKNQLHNETMKALQSENEAWDRLLKLQRSARTEKEREFVRAEAAKLRALSAERERIIAVMKSQLDADELRQR